MLIDTHASDRQFLQVAAINRGQTKLLELRGNVPSGDVVSAGPGLAAFQQIVGEEGHVCAKLLRGYLAGGHRDRGWNHLRCGQRERHCHTEKRGEETLHRGTVRGWPHARTEPQRRLIMLCRLQFVFDDSTGSGCRAVHRVTRQATSTTD